MTTETAVEMPSPWKSQNDSHRDLEISLKNAKLPHFHSRSSLFQKGDDEERRLMGATADQPEDLNDLEFRICLDKWVHLTHQQRGVATVNAESGCLTGLDTARCSTTSRSSRRCPGRF